MKKFSKKYRIRKSREYQYIYRNGCRKANCYFAIYYIKNNLGYSRFGIAASKKLGGAVTRNRVKRVIREVVRLREDVRSLGVDMVIVARRKMVETGFKEANEAFGNLIKDIEA